MQEVIRYTPNNRMAYHPDFHDRHGEPYTEEELSYLCSRWEIDRAENIALALGRTSGSLAYMVHKLRKRGQFERYKRLGKVV